MPTYEYQCDQCGHAFEAFQRISDKPVRVCPECGKRKVRRLISAGGGIVFKGSGFYATDYRKPRPSEDSGKSSSGEGVSTSKGDSSSTSDSKSKSDSKSGSSGSDSTGSDSKPKKGGSK